jgi:hypothetical protein
MNVYLHAQGRVRPEIKKTLDSLINKALRVVARSPGSAAKIAVGRA